MSTPSSDPRAVACSLVAAARAGSDCIPPELADDLARALAAELAREADRAPPAGFTPDADALPWDTVARVGAIDRAIGHVQGRLAWEQGGAIGQALLRAWTASPPR